MQQQQNVIICPKCKGAGRQYRKNKDGSAYLLHGNPVMELCDTCDGAGRLLQLVTIEYAKIPGELILQEQNNTNNTDRGGFIDEIKKKFKKQ